MTRCQMMKGKISPENTYLVQLCHIQSFLHEDVIGCTGHTQDCFFPLTYSIFTDQIQLQAVFTSWAEVWAQKMKSQLGKVLEASLAVFAKSTLTNFLPKLKGSQVLH